MLAHHLSFTSQREADHDEHDDECGNHHDDVGEYEEPAAAEHGRAVPDTVHEDRHQETDNRSQELHGEVV